MLKHYITISIVFICASYISGQTLIKDRDSKIPVSYATVSFGNGNGIFADDDGLFIFTKKLYPDIDTLFISALGYKDLVVPTLNLAETLYMDPEADLLDEVEIKISSNRKFKIQKLKPYLDDDYYNCWLPTIESEIAVYFPNNTSADKNIDKLRFPIALESKDWKKRNKSKSEKQSFSTLFKVKLYESNDGNPGKPLTNETIVFNATENDGEAFNLDMSPYSIRIPPNGFFASIQVLGYADKNGKLLPNKKYKEIKGRNGMVKIPTNFRPLLPFTNELSNHRTFIKRVFVNGNSWKTFKPNNGIQSTLLDRGYYNYGIGLDFKEYRDE